MTTSFLKTLSVSLQLTRKSHYIEVELVKNTSVEETITALRIIFSHNGLPDVICSDNASCFTSYLFAQFLQNNGIEHITSSPFCPSSNGLAERGVRTIKELLKKLGNANSSSLKSRLAQVLLYQRSVPHSLTQIMPSVALNNRKYVNARDRIHPSYNNNAIKKTQMKQIAQFEVGESVFSY